MAPLNKRLLNESSLVGKRPTVPLRTVLAVATFLVSPIFSLLGCGTSINVQPLTPADIPLVRAAGNFPHEKYVIVPDDEIKIRYTYHPEMSQEAVVQPDGKITAILVGPIIVAGMTTAKLEELLVEKTSDQLRRPEVVVSITKFAVRNVYIGGEVGKPGMLPYRQGLTPLQAVIASGGFLDSARADSVVLIRNGDLGSEVISRKLNLTESVADAIKEPLFLAPHDVVYVPKTSISEANFWVKQHITDLFPFLWPSTSAALGVIRLGR